MYEYDLTLAGLRVRLQTPHAIGISDRLQPFLDRWTGQIDCTISLCGCDPLPAMSPKGKWRGPEYYENNGDTMRIFHCNTVHGVPFAVTQLSKRGNVEIRVLPGSLSLFEGTSGIFNRIGMENLLLQHEGLLLHASLIKYENRSIAFTGPSGVGKSTQAELWHDQMGAKVLNGDRAVLRWCDKVWQAYGSPYAGTSGIYCNDSAPLGAIVVLKQAKENRLQHLTPVQALRQLYPELSIHRWDSCFTTRATDLCLAMLECVPVYMLECLPDKSAVALLKKGLEL